MSKERRNQQFVEWCREHGDWEACINNADSDMDLALSLTAPGPPKVVIQATGGKGQDWILLQHSVEVPKASFDIPSGSGPTFESPSCDQLIDNITNTRAALLQAEIESSAGSLRVLFSHRVYLDGLSKQTFIGALYELVKARRMLDTLVNQMEQHRVEIARLRETLTPTPGKRESRVEENKRKSLLEVPTARTPPPIPPPTPRRCANCGQTVRLGKRFCTSCGTAVT